MSYTSEHHDYIYASGKLLREVITTTEVNVTEGTETVTGTTTLDFFYDANGTPFAMRVDEEDEQVLKAPQR